MNLSIIANIISLPMTVLCFVINIIDHNIPATIAWGVAILLTVELVINKLKQP